MKIHKSTIQLLRIPFSINLLPIFLFAVYLAFDNLILWKTGLVFLLIHFVFYPASNAYNSYMDNDTAAIAGIEKPPEATKQLFTVSIFLDSLGLLLSLLVSLPFTLVNLFLMLLSRAYSWRRIRIKKYAILAFLMVSLAQGGISFYNMFVGIQGLSSFPEINTGLLKGILVATLFVGAIYPITQIYQHDSDREDGVRTISMLLGIKGTFIFSGFLFLLSNVILYLIIPLRSFVAFEIFMLFPIVYFLYWAIISWKNVQNADYKHTMIMAVGASLAMILGFATILLIKICL